MRVVSGEFGGRRLVTPEGASTRPTTDKVRQAVFNSLDSAGLIDGATVVDLFAGSGAMGIEAISRGAARCTFVENGRAALAALRANIDALGLAGRATVVAVDAVMYAASMEPVDLVLIDPPYQFSAWTELLARPLGGVLVAESDRGVDLPAGWELTRVKRYGRTYITMATRVA